MTLITAEKLVRGNGNKAKASILHFCLIFLSLYFCPLLVLRDSAIAANSTTNNQNTNRRNNNRNTNPDEFPPSPLEIKIEEDPLLPRTPKELVKNPLSEEEKAGLTIALDALNTEAASKLALGDRPGAFEIWYRELRLRRYLGQVPEVQALGRVGAIAWEQNQREDVRYITRRLQEIQKQAQAKSPLELELLRAFSTAYDQVKAPNLAIPMYEQILAATRQQQDAAAEEATLLTIGNLSLSSFDYIKAASIYQELLNSAQARSDRLNEVVYLKQLIYIYDQAKQHQMAIKAKEQLAELYLNAQDFIQIPALRLSIGSNYEALGLLEQAAQNYQEAYASSFQLQMFDRASEALEKLGTLFETTNQTEQALEVYKILLTVHDQARDFYGMMNVYDRIGKIALTLQDNSLALEAFQKGLIVAQELKYREAYFSQRIEEVTKQGDR